MEGTKSVKDCSRCEALTKTGIRCKARTCMGHLCWQHAMRDVGVRVLPSKIPNAGKGLFAVRDFKKGETVAMYHAGPCMTRDEFETKYPGDLLVEYGLCYGNQCSNPYKTNQKYARYANHQRGSMRNADLVGKSCNTFRIKATKNIKASRKDPMEVYVDYGNEYWKSSKESVSN